MLYVLYKLLTNVLILFNVEEDYMVKANYVKIAPKISSMLMTRPGMFENLYTNYQNYQHYC